MRILTLMVAMVAISIQSFSQGIIFENLKYDEAITKAKTENKMVFLDCYTMGCAPCKTMAEQVFTQAKAGDYFNPRFINIKIDIEKGEGPELKKRLGIIGYPTFIIADGDGNIIAKFVGGSDIDTFIKKVEEANSKSFTESNKKYESGKMTIEEKIEYVGMLTEALENDKAKEIASALFASASKKEKISTMFWPLYNNSRITHLSTEYFDFMVENKKEFDKIVGKEEVDNKMYNTYYGGLSGDIYGNIPGIKVRSASELSKHLENIKKLDIDGKNMLSDQCGLALARANNDAVKMVEYMEKMMPMINDYNVWNYASSFIKVFENKPELKSNPKVKAIGQILADKAPEDSKKYYNKVFDLK